MSSDRTDPLHQAISHINSKGISHWALVQYAEVSVSESIYRLIKPIVGTDGYGSQSHGYPRTNRDAGSRLAQPRLSVKKASKSRGMTSGSMPFPEPNRDVDAPRYPTARCSLPLLKSPCFSTLIVRAYWHLEFRTNPASPPPLAYFCDVCAAQNFFGSGVE